LRNAITAFAKRTSAAVAFALLRRCSVHLDFGLANEKMAVFGVFERFLAGIVLFWTFFAIFYS